MAGKVFISHSHADRAAATNLQRVLEKHQVQTYLDQDNIQAGDRLPDRIRKGIKSCDAFLLLWSAKASRSDWVDREWNAAYDLRKRIIPYCLDATPLPDALDNLVFVDRKDEQVAHAGLLRAVLGRSFAPSSDELFPGTWNITLSAFGLGTASYNIELRANGQITGTSQMNQGGPFGETMAAEGMAGLLNMKSNISGTWEYEEHSEILTLNLITLVFGRRAQETIQIRSTGREQGEITGQDFAGRDYVIRRVPAVREVRAAYRELRGVLAWFKDAPVDPVTFGDDIETVVAAVEAAYGAAEGKSLVQTLRTFTVAKEGLAARALVAKGVAAFLIQKVDDKLSNLSS